MPARFRPFCLLLLACLLTVSAAMARAESPRRYTVYVVPQVAPAEIQQAWLPLLGKLSRETRLVFELRVPPTIPAFEAALEKGEADFAFMNPYHLVMARRAQGYLPLVRDARHPLVGILTVARNSPIRSLRDLNGEAVAFPAPNAFAASLYMRALLASQKVNITPHYVHTHSQVYRQVLAGDVAAGGGVNTTLRRESEETQAGLRILYTTPPTATHPLAAHPRVPTPDRVAVAAALLRLALDPANGALFENVQLDEPVMADYQTDYLPLERLGLDRYVVRGGR